MGWTRLSAVWLLLLLAQMIAITESISSEGHQLPGPKPCSNDEYLEAGRCCKRCPAGEFVEEPCLRAHTQGKCSKCDRGTFTAFANGLDSCQSCSSCRDDQEMVTECCPTSDRMCQCKTGHFYHVPGADEYCMPCDECPEGSLVLWKCNATSNTGCGEADPNSGNQQYLLLSILPVLGVMAVVAFYFLRKHRPWKHCHLSNSTGRAGGSPVAGNANELENMFSVENLLNPHLCSLCVNKLLVDNEWCMKGRECHWSGSEFYVTVTNTSDTASDEERRCILSQRFGGFRSM